MQDMENSQLADAIRQGFGVKSQEGTNSETVEAAEKAEPADAQAEEAGSDDKGDTPEAKESAKPEEKRRGNVPKILRERNELRRKVQELENKLKEAPEASAEASEAEPADLDSKIAAIIEEREQKKATQQFFESNTDAKAKKKAVEALMDDHGLPVDDAWALYLAKNDPKALAKNSSKAYSSPSVPNFGNRKEKSLANMSLQELKSLANEMHQKGELSI